MLSKITVKDIMETISSIPLHIGVSHFKAIVYFTILPLFLKWSNKYPLSMDDVKLHNKNWVKMLLKGPGNENVDAIKSKVFTFKGKVKTCQYLLNKVLDLYLGISYAKQNEIDNYIEECKIKTVLVCYKFSTCVHMNSNEADHESFRTRCL
jgi:hypothetical protein